MEQITKKQFVHELMMAEKVSLIYGGFVSEKAVMEKLDEIKAFQGVYDRYIFHIGKDRLIFKLIDGSLSHLTYDQKCDGRIHYKMGDVLIRKELHNDYKPNFCIYKVKGTRTDVVAVKL